ncbi:MAG: helix-turn-helix transcriptional regulator [Muribaculaceae bacterium]
MPNTKNAFIRYQIIDRLLADRNHSYSLDDITRIVSDEIAEKYPDSCGDGVTRRTIEKDIRYLEYENPILADIERYSEESYDTDRQRTYTKRCLRYVDPSFSIFNKGMTEEELNLLGSTLAILGQFDGLPGLKSLQDLQAKLSEKPQQGAPVVLLSANPRNYTKVFSELYMAIVRKQVVRLTYHLFEGDADGELSLHGRSTEVHPYLLKEYANRWFLLCRAQSDAMMLTFALDRIDEVEPLLSHHYEAYEGDLNEWYDDIIGVTNRKKAPVLNITCWVSDREMEYVDTKPMHGSYRKVRGDADKALRERYPHLQGGMFFTLECKNNYELVRELTTYGADLLVLSPEEVVEQVRIRVNRMQEAYRKV